jgi:hypothetical protein
MGVALNQLEDWRMRKGPSPTEIKDPHQGKGREPATFRISSRTGFVPGNAGDSGPAIGKINISTGGGICRFRLSDPIIDKVDDDLTKIN